MYERGGVPQLDIYPEGLLSGLDGPKLSMWIYTSKLIDLILVLVPNSKNQKIFIGARAFGYKPLSIANTNRNGATKIQASTA